MKILIVSYAEDEVGYLFNNGQEAETIRTTLHIMRHTQPDTPMKTESFAANGIVNHILHQKPIKSHGYAILLN